MQYNESKGNNPLSSALEQVQQIKTKWDTRTALARLHQTCSKNETGLKETKKKQKNQPHFNFNKGLISK